MDELLFGVIGDPILHSQSPALFRQLFRASSLEGTYLRVAARSASDGLTLARHLGLSGLNVTAPFKEEMAKLLHVQNGSVNSVRLGGSVPEGISTDPLGVVGPLGELSGKKALVIGAGGAARAALMGLIQRGAIVALTNRTEEKGKILADEFRCNFLSPSSTEIREVDILINTVPALLFPKEFISERHTTLDAIYHFDTPFTQAARAQGARVIPGSEWLIHQGVAAFSFFTGLTIERSAVQSISSVERQSTIYLLGMMGCGKSTIGPLLASALSWDFVELDSEIECRAGMSIAELFRASGEGAFRALEREALALTNSRRRIVVSLGGGAIVGNTDLLPAASVKVWLFSPLEELQNRLSGGVGRPLLHGHDIPERLATLWRERRMLYAKVSDLVVPTYGWSAGEATRRICDEIRKAGID